ncbi:MAG: TA system VapC family ribonuclease toxin [Myxococcota bacterium]
MRYLLDVNVLLALMDPAHVMHGAAHAWFEKSGSRSWATCPLTQNGVVRIAGQPSYPNSPGAPSVVADLLERFTSHARHELWHDDVSILETRVFNRGALGSPAQLTDVYLLGLAMRHNGKLATFDRRIPTGAVRDGAAHLTVIPATS